MIDLNASIKALEAAREQLLNQIGAVERAITILRGETHIEGTRDAEPQAQASESSPNSFQSQPTVPTQRKGRMPGFKLSEAHKRALIEGRRKKRQGMSDDKPVAHAPLPPIPAVAAWKADTPPRLVRPEPEPVRELTVVRDDPFAELLEEAAALR
jgi:hypothetical protein